MSKSNVKIILTAGGTGGHVFPAEALAKELTARGVSVGFVTDGRGDSFSKNFPQATVHRVRAGAYAGKPALKKLLALFAMGAGVLQSLLIFLREKPDAVVGFGGYAAFPASFAAGILGIPLILHEQNAVLGGANRFLAKRASLIATTFPTVERVPAKIKTAYTGVPVRPAVLALRDADYAPAADTFNLLVFGGSQGAGILSSVVPAALKSLPDSLKSRLRVAQQCRAADLDAVDAAYTGSGIAVETAPFFTDMADRLAAAHLVVCRAGASSIAELAVAGRPAVIVPILRSPDAHQLKNASFMAKNGGAFLCEEPDFTPDRLADMIKRFADDPSLLAQTARKAKELGKPDAVRLFADAVLNTARA